MKSVVALLFTCCFTVSFCFVGSLLAESDLIKRKEKCGEYLTYEDCLKEAYVIAAKCREINENQLKVDIYKTCDEYLVRIKKLCLAYCAKASCLRCFEKMEEIVENCSVFSQRISCKLNSTANECKETKAAVVKYCSQNECNVCRESFCRNGGKCAGSTSSWCSCPAGFSGAFCQINNCAAKPCQNGGTCKGINLCECPSPYSGAQCKRKRLGTKVYPAPSAQAILDAGDSVGSGMYWIQPPGETSAAETYCDMSFAGGGWMLASYGYVHTTGTNGNNKAIPNMNNPFGFDWLPTKRSSRNGVINLPHGAVKMAINASYMLMAAGNNPSTGGIDQYGYVYRISLKNSLVNITFANHNRYNGGQPGRMHIQKFIVEALKGESGTYVRFGLAEALGVTWPDSYPTGYGFSEMMAPNAAFHKGPFFPSVHSGSGRSPCGGCTATDFAPDVPGGSPHYTHRGWYSANNFGKTGQTSIWFK
ncbi:PREDICTED: uncharacterized protein LOC107330791 [Acropora digitifera]|uniref:uncharacterized protein LOC107330791 n=1 Tax=Acropora digitifera TaxID=70779 RepID=UPI00077ABE0F|nr:PREDICTED: uncharacterized protein LOC107330791 [Acropora digitifera]